MSWRSSWVVRNALPGVGGGQKGWRGLMVWKSQEALRDQKLSGRQSRGLIRSGE